MEDIPTFDLRGNLPEEIAELLDNPQGTTVIPAAPAAPANGNPYEQPSRFTSPVYVTRDFPSAGISTDIRGITHIDAALDKAGLNYKIIQVPAKFGNRNEVAPHRVANVREDTGEFIEFVSDRYKPFQNHQAYSFLEGILQSGALELVSAGQFDYSSVYIESKTPHNIQVLGETYYPYSLIKNSHDGNGSVTVCFTGTRVVCRNTLALAVDTATRIWRARHLKTLEERMKEASKMLRIQDQYWEQYPVMAEKLNSINLTPDDIAGILQKAFPLKPSAGVTAIRNANESAREILTIYNETPDIAPFAGNAYGFMLATSDWATHHRPGRETQNWKALRLNELALGHPVMESVQAALLAIPA